MDLAVFELEKNPSEKYSPIEFSSDNLSLSQTDAYILHYPKISLDDEDLDEKTFFDTELQIRAPYAQYTFENCATKGQFAKEKWSLDNSLAYSIQHTCDQIDGSSGSALISAEDSTLLGVNWGGIELMEPESNDPLTINVATSINNVRVFLTGDIAAHKQQAVRQAQDALQKQKTSSESSGNAIINTCGVTGNGRGLGFILMYLPLVLVFIRKRI